MCHSDQGPPAPTEVGGGVGPRPSFQFNAGTVSLVGAGNIARCDRTNDEATANLLDGISGSVFALGDNAYPNGTPANFNCYNASWGRHKARTYPAAGNHEYDSSATAAAYFAYFGAAAGSAPGGYYSYDIGNSWHVIVLNSNSTKVATAVGSPQETWLRADLAANTKPCVLAMWHHPRFYSTTASSLSPTASVKPFWDDLINAHATLIVNAHMRDYERFAPQSSAGVADPVNGIRQITVGTGGEGLDATNTLIAPNSEVRISGVYGVLALTLGQGSYSWQFVPVAGQTGSDDGAGACWGQGPMTPVVDAGPDKQANAGDTVRVTISFTDPGPNDAPWNYQITWGDGTSTTGTKASVSPIAESHVYTALTLDSVRVTVTNAFGMSGSDWLAVQAAPTGQVVLVGAGDIADAATPGDSLTANLLDGIAGTVFTLGDNAYDMGSASDFANNYNPTWGRHKSRTKPTPGNHEYSTPGASGYFGYFGAAAGDPAKGYYSYDLGAWHIIALNGEVDITPLSAEVQWLRSDLALHSAKCTLAYWHAPRFVSGVAITSNPKYQTLWDTLYKYGADVVINGHKHSYERLAPQTPAQVRDTLYGLRSFVVGTGGTGLDGGNPPAVPNSEVRNTNTWGVLKLTLNADSYTWQFIPVAGSTFMDAGSGLCHYAPSVVNHAPVAVANGPSSGTEGTSAAFNGSGSSDSDGDALTYAWTFADGTSGTGVTPSHTYVDNGTYTVSLTVTDARGLASSPATTTITVANATAVVAAAPQSASVDAGFSFTATFSDAGTGDGPWSYTIDWGDSSSVTTGSAASQSNPITAAHTYASTGSKSVTVAVTDKDGGAGSATATVTVAGANNVPTAAPGGPYTGSEGSPVAFNGAGSSDPDGDALTYAWTFGDGTTGSGVAPSHTYVDNGTFVVTLTVTDTHGASSQPTGTTATIANVAPTVNAGANQTAAAGTPLTVNATFSDPGINDATFSYSIDWGDGTGPTTGTKSTAAAPIQATHIYTAAGTFVATVTVTDKDGGAGSSTATMTISPPVVAVTLVGAGNIARCDRTNDEATAAILDTIAGTVFALGDAAYPNGTPANYNCYAPSWGRHKARTYAATGNHDYDSSSTAAGYVGYFGAAGGDPGKGYYGYDLGAWHIVVLNSNTSFVPAAAGSAQETWLKADLAANTKQCVLAMWHSPRFYSTTSSSFSPTSSVKPFWDDLYAAGAELIINAHMRDYERFGPQSPAGAADPVNGIREIIVGTGGEGLDSPNTLIIPNSEARISGVYGVLKLSLGEGTYAWQFIPVAGQTATDAGTGTCH
ncbi:MAG TPA: PKD domain-containing protein [Gemmatimonadales bacterium]|nr:PKD domain-containing protein [Gemmatimonadales bacterium]